MLAHMQFLHVTTDETHTATVPASETEHISEGDVTPKPVGAWILMNISGYPLEIFPAMG